MHKVHNTNKPMVNHFKALLQGVKDDLPPKPDRIILTDCDFNNVISLLKTNKAAGPDFLEAIINADPVTREELRSMMEDILNGSEISEEWCESSILPIHKKGDPLTPSNYRGKVLAMIVNRRLLDVVEEKKLLPDTQNGFRTERSTVDNIMIFNQAIHQCLGKKKFKLFALFVDFKTAFDLVNRRLTSTS